MLFHIFHTLKHLFHSLSCDILFSSKEVSAWLVSFFIVTSIHFTLPWSY